MKSEARVEKAEAEEMCNSSSPTPLSRRLPSFAQQMESHPDSFEFAQEQDHQDSFTSSHPHSAHSERSEWLDVEEFQPSMSGSASMLPSRSHSSQGSDQDSFYSILSHPFHNHQPQRQHQESVELQPPPHFCHPVHSPPAWLRSNRNENQDPLGSLGESDPQWSSNQVETPEQHGPSFSYIDSGSKLAEQPRLTPIRVSKACTPCREKRIRCQGGHPHCTSCIEKNRTHLCVYRIIPPRTITRKVLEHVQHRLERTEVQLQQSRDAIRDLNARLWEADKELETLKSGEKVRELERQLRELKGGSLDSQTQYFSPNQLQETSHEFSPPQGSKGSFGTERHWATNEKGPQNVDPARRSPSFRPYRMPSDSSLLVSQRTENGGRVGQGPAPSRRRAATTTSTVNPLPSINPNQDSKPIFNFSFGGDGGLDLKGGFARQSFSASSIHGPTQDVPRSHSVSSCSSISSLGYPSTTRSLSLSSSPVLDFGSGEAGSSSQGSLESFYRQTPFNNRDTVHHSLLAPQEVSDSRQMYQYIDSKLHHEHHEQTQNSKQHLHRQQSPTSHSHSQSMCPKDLFG